MDSPQDSGAGSSSSSSKKSDMGSSSSQSSFKFQLLVEFSTTPVLGCRIDPAIRVTNIDFATIDVPPKHEFTCRWYREYISSSSPRKNIKCSVHPDESATFRCTSCETLKLPVKGSYYCSKECYREAWKKHKVCHRRAQECLPDNQQAATDSDYISLVFNERSVPDKSPKLERKGGKEWVEVCSSNSYVPIVDDIGCCLMLESIAVDCSSGLHLCPIHSVVTDPVLYPLAQKPRSMLECLRKNHWKAHSSNGVKFSVLSYNLLANLYANRNKYPECPEWALSWEYRRQNLLNEIIEYDADILCLQEVQSSHLENFFKPELTKCGYSVIYKRRRNQVYTRDGLCMDGCATFYRRDVFKEIEKYELEFESSVMRVVEALEPEQRNEASDRLEKDNVAIVVILEKLENEDTSAGIQPRICVANTHIFANPTYPDVKLFQVVDLITGLDKIAELKIPVLVCGDFNSVPLSEPYRFISARGLNNLPDKDTDPLGICQHLKLHHSLPLHLSSPGSIDIFPAAHSSKAGGGADRLYFLGRSSKALSARILILMSSIGTCGCDSNAENVLFQKSAYASFFNLDGIKEEQRKKMNFESGEPLFTHFTSRFTGTLDYIFYTVDSLTLDGVLELLRSEDLGSGIPSSHWSSDHIALMASFVLDSTSCQKQCSRAIPANPWQRATATQ